MPTCTSSVSEVKSESLRASESSKTCYQTDQQVKLLTLQAEVESLLYQLQNLKQQRIALVANE
ncbi:MAG: hypothetical protein KME60_30105 [Cyanomargarita calcarea GSE-NOS-MK-12-04C]|jgi:hypothetical protein|uniref:Uncharacterized protein n=1 Tax=Cyanomargarita calcarea GSE-NOS-MK-12-04C TaxID=2839659 RepID=A0A951QSV3_9CYAN|nr:hypothetical protein [Cyanomargarita calcarea GSE-NOS-MK-12-04C]